MNPYFLLPLSPTLDSAAAAVATNPASNVLNDEPALTYRSTSNTVAHVVVDFGAATSIDCVAVLGSNVLATDGWRVRAGTTAGNTSSSPTYDSAPLATWTGTKTASKARLVHQFTAHSQRFWRVDWSSVGHPDGYIEAARLLIGLKVEMPVPLPTRARQFIVDPSLIEEGDGWESIDEREAQRGWQLQFDWISDANWRSTVWPFLQRAKLSRRALFVPFPDQPELLQDSACFGRLRSFETEHPLHDGGMADITIVSNGL